MKRLKRIAISASFLLALCAQGVSAANQQIEDMPSNWAKAAVEKAVEQSWLTPYNGRVNPNRALTRAEMAAIVGRIFGASSKGDIGMYSDVSATKWYAGDMAKAVQMGAFKGEGDKLYPERNISRQEAFTVIGRILEMKNSGNTKRLNEFADRAAISEWASESIASLAESGYIKGFGSLLRPNDEITRAEFAQLMSNITGTLLAEPGEHSGTYAGNLLISAPGTTLKNSVISGDLILCDGVGAGDVLLDHVTLEGRLVIRGGGKDTVQLVSSQVKGDVIINNINNAVRLLADGGTSLQNVLVSNQVILGAEISKLTVSGQAAVTIQSGKVTNIEVDSAAVGTKITVESGAVVNSVSVSAENTELTGKGQVENVAAKADNLSVHTPGTKVTAAAGISGVRAGGTAVEPGKTAVIDKSGVGIVTETKSGSGGGGSNSGGTDPGGNEPGGNEPGGNEPGENEPDETPTAKDWVDLRTTGIIKVDFASYATVALNRKEMTATPTPGEYDYYINGVKLSNTEDVSVVMNSADGNLLVIKMLLPGNGTKQILKLVKDKEYMLIQLNDIGASVKQ
ncbi:MAG: Ig-like surface protein [Bacillota bacterium]|nr:Ig-like surface protein [Bacillota bacterium]